MRENRLSGLTRGRGQPPLSTLLVAFRRFEANRQLEGLVRSHSSTRVHTVRSVHLSPHSPREIGSRRYTLQTDALIGFV